MRTLALFLILGSLSGCGSIRLAHKNCQPVFKDQLEVMKMLTDPEQEWVCDEPWWRR